MKQLACLSDLNSQFLRGFFNTIIIIINVIIITNITIIVAGISINNTKSNKNLNFSFSKFKDHGDNVDLATNSMVTKQLWRQLLCVSKTEEDMACKNVIPTSTV